MPEYDEEQVREMVNEMREQWLDEDEERYQAMAQETAYEVFEEQLEQRVAPKLYNQDETISSLVKMVEELQEGVKEQMLQNQIHKDLTSKSIKAEHENIQARFKLQRDNITAHFENESANLKENQEKFRLNMKEAFEIFKVSTELEQTKRMRQIGDFVATQQRLLGQINFNEKNYQIFQKTSGQICEQIGNILELLRLQNSLNFQEEKDKSQISLLGSSEPEKSLADIGSTVDEKGKSFMRAPDKSGLSFGADLLGSSLARPEDNAHVEIEKRCQICNQDNNSRHYVTKAMKIACLKYRSGLVKHYGQTYDRLKLIKIQEDLVEQHIQQLRAIEGGK